MARPVKGQQTLDAANARRSKAAIPTREEASNETALATMTPESGYEKPKTLRQLEHIVESKALKGAGLWREAADALMIIKEQKLWKQARDDEDKPYASFVVYAEARFGFKKTYAYDLVKAASRKPDALTEGSARAEMQAEAAPRAINRSVAIQRMESAWQKFEDRCGDLRDRAIEDLEFVHGYDQTMRLVGEAFRDFLTNFAPIPGSATEIVSPTRETPSDQEPSKDGEA